MNRPNKISFATAGHQSQLKRKHTTLKKKYRGLPNLYFSTTPMPNKRYFNTYSIGCLTREIEHSKMSIFLNVEQITPDNVDDMINNLPHLSELKGKSLFIKRLWIMYHEIGHWHQYRYDPMFRGWQITRYFNHISGRYSYARVKHSRDIGEEVYADVWALNRLRIEYPHLFCNKKLNWKEHTYEAPMGYTHGDQWVPSDKNQRPIDDGLDPSTYTRESFGYTDRIIDTTSITSPVITQEQYTWTSPAGFNSGSMDKWATSGGASFKYSASMTYTIPKSNNWWE